MGGTRSKAAVRSVHPTEGATHGQRIQEAQRPLHRHPDVYYAERQILKTLPKIAKAASSPDLKAAFEKHRDETERQVERLTQVFEIAVNAPRGKTCDAILGIIEESKEIMEDYADSPALDAGRLAAAQAVEHYEITPYGTLKTWATQLGLEDAAALLEQTLREEETTDELLTKIGVATRVPRASPKERPPASQRAPAAEPARHFPGAETWASSYRRSPIVPPTTAWTCRESSRRKARGPPHGCRASSRNVSQ